MPWQVAVSFAMSAQHTPVAHAVVGQLASALPLELPVPLLPVPLLLPVPELLPVPLLDVPLELVMPLELPPPDEDVVPLDVPPPSSLPPPPELVLLLHAIQTNAQAAMAAVPNEAETVIREAMGFSSVRDGAI